MVIRVGVCGEALSVVSHGLPMAYAIRRYVGHRRRCAEKRSDGSGAAALNSRLERCGRPSHRLRTVSAEWDVGYAAAGASGTPADGVTARHLAVSAPSADFLLMLVGGVFDLFPAFFHVLAQPGHRVAPSQAGEAGKHQDCYQ